MLVLSLSLVGIARAQLTMSFPESGEYRVGQFMYVDVRVDEAWRDRPFLLWGDGILWTRVEMNGQAHARAPILTLSNDVRRLSWTFLRSSPHEVNQPLTSRPSESGSLTALAGDDAFAPTVAWNPGASIRLRRPAMLASILVALLTLGGATLLRGRKAVIAIACVAAIGVLAFEIARRNISPVWRAEGQIIVASADGTAQIDRWQYITTRATSPVSVELPDGAIPVFVNAEHAQTTNASLHYDAARKITTLHCVLQPGMRVAVVQRRATAQAASPLPTTQPIGRALRSPMSELARRMYVDQHTRIVDEVSVEWTDDQLVHWASVILWRER